VVLHAEALERRCGAVERRDCLVEMAVPRMRHAFVVVDARLARQVAGTAPGDPCEAEAREVRDDHGHGTGEEPGEEDGGHADLDRLGLGLAEGQAHRDEVAADLRVDGEQCRECVLRWHVAGRDAGAEQHADDLRDHGTRAEDRGQDRDAAEDADGDQAGQAAGQRLHQVRECVAEAGRVDDADDHRDEGHERQDVADDRVDGVPAGLIEHADHLADGLADLHDHVVEAAHGAASAAGAGLGVGGAHAAASSVTGRRDVIRKVMNSVRHPRMKMTTSPTRK